MAVGAAVGLSLALPTFGLSLVFAPGIGTGVGCVAGYRTAKEVERSQRTN